MTTFGQILDAIRRAITWWVLVNPWEQALRVRLGKHVRELGPGIHFQIPFVDRVYLQSIRFRMCILQSQTITTLDNKVVTLAGVVGYVIEDLRLLYDTLHQPEASIDGLICGAIADYVALNPASECCASKIATSVIEEVDLGQFGIGQILIRLTDLAFVKTYRMITGDGTRWSSGSVLETVKDYQAHKDE